MKVAAIGARTVILKGVDFGDGMLGVAIYDVNSDTIQYYFTKKSEKSSHGTGDCYASACTGGLMQGRSVYKAASIAADFVVECIIKTLDDDSHWYGVKFEKALPMLIKEFEE